MLIRNKVSTALIMLLMGSVAFAFEWDMSQFPEGDQSYVIEMRMGDAEEQQVLTLEIDVREDGEGNYTVTNTSTSEFQVSNLDMGVLTGTGFSGVLGPALMLGPVYMFAPLLLQGQDIAVRSEPMIVAGMGTLHMNRSEEVAGFECVVIRFEPNDDPDQSFEFALAEGVPFPCFTRYGQGGESVEMRLLSANL